jgi:Putative peptidoglycan binding domain
MLAVAITTVGVNASAGFAAGKSSIPQPFSANALWVTQVNQPAAGQEIVAEAARAGVGTLYVKAAEGSNLEVQFSSVLVSEMRDAGATVCAWTFASGANPASEAAAAIAAVHEGAQCLVVDAENQYDGRYGAAQSFVRALRIGVGSAFPIGLASEAEVLQHPRFPYSVFLGPGGFNVVLPQIYWLDFGVSVEAACASAIGVNSIYGRPILPVGQLYSSPTPTELALFRALVRAFGAAAWSFFDLDIAQPEQLAALRAPMPARARKASIMPTLRAGADGDEIVWAQELLNAAGAHLPVGGFFGAETAHAVAAFQRRHRLRVSETLGPATWKALLRRRPREPSWASGSPDSARWPDTRLSNRCNGHQPSKDSTHWRRPLRRHWWRTRRPIGRPRG